MTNIHLRFLVLGAGAIGTYIGGSLQQGGQEVVFLDQPEAAARLVNQGIRIIRDGSEYRIVNLEVVDNLNEALTHGPYDAAILAVKSYDTAGLAQNLSAYRMALPPVICLQNGIGNEQLLVEALGEEKVIPGTVTTAIGRTPNGAIKVEKLRGVGLSDDHVLSPALLSVFNQACLKARLYDNPRSLKWSKLLTNLLANATSAILDMTPAQIFSDPRLYQVEARALRETLAVMNAEKIPVIDLPATPVRALAAIAGSLPAWLSRMLLQPSLARGRGAKMPSFYLDLHAGRGKSEVGWLNGAVVRFAQQNGLEAPVNAFLTKILTRLTEGQLPMDHYARNTRRFISDLNSSHRS